jgi:ComF family protein
MIQMARGLSRSILNIVYKTLFPLQCQHCNKEGSFLCRPCEGKLRYLGAAGQRGIESEHISRLISCFPYEDPISNLVILGKYSFLSQVFPYLAKLSAAHLVRQGMDFKDFILCPIPLSSQRLRWRGFNQSEKLGETFSLELGLPYKQYLIRRRNTKTQKDLSRLARQRNVHNCFALNPAFAGTIDGQNILLVDDVATTGATLNAAAETLIKAGARAVWALTIARD